MEFKSPTAVNLHMLPIVGLDQKAFITFQTFVVDVFMLVSVDVQLLLVNKGLAALNALVSAIICRLTTNESTKICYFES